MNRREFLSAMSAATVGAAVAPYVPSVPPLKFHSQAFQMLSFGDGSYVMLSGRERIVSRFVDIDWEHAPRVYLYSLAPKERV